jgi:predicted metal-dependent hydrolase
LPKISNSPTDFNYKFVFSKRAKYIRIQINPAGNVDIIVPRGGSVIKAQKFLLEKKEWILKHLSRIIVKEENYKFLGQKIYIEQQFDLFIKKFKIELIGNKLLFIIPEGKEIAESKLFEEWLKNKAIEYLPERIRTISKNINLNFNKINIRGHKSRWGSCSKNKNLSFNYKLMCFSKEVIDYVIIHELCHLKEMNHSKRFWNLIEYYMPDYKKYKMLLKGIS